MTFYQHINNAEYPFLQEQKNTPADLHNLSTREAAFFKGKYYNRNVPGMQGKNLQYKLKRGYIL
jgi:hypothetical protein